MRGRVVHLLIVTADYADMSLLAARRKLLLVSGAYKREALRRALDGPITPEVPASYLQVSEEVTVIADTAAWPCPQRAMSMAGRV